MSTREELESIILFRSQEGTEKDRYGNLKKAAIAAGVLGAAGGGIYAAKKIGRGVGRLAKGGEDVLKRVSGVLGEVHHNATDIGQYAHAAIPKAEAYVASTAPKVEAYVKDHIIPITEKAKGVVETMHKGLQPMRDYGALYRAGREGAFFVPKLTSNPKKWWSNVKAGWNEGRHGAPATMDPYYHDPEIAAKAQPHIERWVKRIGKTKESIAKRAPGAGRPFATSAGPVMQWSARRELDSIISFNWQTTIADKLSGNIGKAALRWGGIGAAGGAIAGGVSGALSDDPSRSAIGGALQGAAAGGILGAGAGAAKEAGLFKGILGAKPKPGPAIQPLAQKPNVAKYSKMPAKVNNPDAVSATRAADARANREQFDSMAAQRKANPNQKEFYDFSSRLQSLVQLSAELDGVISFGSAPRATAAFLKKTPVDWAKMTEAEKHLSKQHVIASGMYAPEVHEKVWKSLATQGKDAVGIDAASDRKALRSIMAASLRPKLTQSLYAKPLNLSAKAANDPDSRINKSLKAWNCSAREDLNTILFAKKGGDYKRHWSQKKTDPKKKSTKKDEDSDESPAMEKKEHCMSAREELEVIQFGNAMPDHLSDEQKTSLWAHLQKNGITKDRLRDTVLKMRKATADKQQLSARDQLNTILMGVDPRPRNPLGEFSGAEEGAPDPHKMKITYGGLAAGAAGGAAFQGGGMALKALVEKLKKAKK